LASIWLSGAAAATGELGAALAEPIRTGAPIDEKKKSRLIVIALMFVLLNVFIIFFLISLGIFFVFSVVM
jgi:hypothetical protein